jgi:osmotically-inducible protein OsmY
MRHVMRLGGAVVLGAGLMLLVTACAVVDADPQSEVNEALKAARIDHVAPIWDGQRNELRLRGIVVDAAERQQAEQVAASVLKGRGTIVNEVTVTLRGAPQPAPVVAEAEDLERIDERIHKDVEALFADETVWKGREITVLVSRGSVRLTGTALSQEDKDRITEMVARVAGVKEVINRLDLKQQI